MQLAYILIGVSNDSSKSFTKKKLPSKILIELKKEIPTLVNRIIPDEIKTKMHYTLTIVLIH